MRPIVCHIRDGILSVDLIGLDVNHLCFDLNKNTQRERGEALEHRGRRPQRRVGAHPHLKDRVKDRTAILSMELTIYIFSKSFVSMKGGHLFQRRPSDFPHFTRILCGDWILLR